MCMDPTGEQLDATAKDAPVHIRTYTYMRHTHTHTHTYAWMSINVTQMCPPVPQLQMCRQSSLLCVLTFFLLHWKDVRDAWSSSLFLFSSCQSAPPRTKRLLDNLQIIIHLFNWHHPWWQTRDAVTVTSASTTRELPAAVSRLLADSAPHTHTHMHAHTHTQMIKKFGY